MFKNNIFKLMILGLIAFVVLAGCSSDKEDSKGSDKSGDNKEKVELSLWLTPQWEGVLDPSEEGADYDSFFKHAAERFEEEYEDYDVEINVEVVASDQRDELLNVNLNGGTPPDIFYESVFAMGEYAHRGALVPMTDIVDDEAREDIDESYWESVTFGEDVYFYPYSHMPGTLTYNADMFKAAGLEEYLGDEDEIKTWTLEEYETILNTLKSDLPEDEYPNANPMSLYALDDQGDTWNLAYMRMFGNDFFDEEGNIVLGDEDGAKAVEWLNGIYEDGLTNPGAESVSSNDTIAMFQNEQLAINFTNSVLFNNKKADMESGEAPEFDIRLANIPSESGDPLSFTYVTGAAIFDTGDEQRIEVSKDFVEFFSTDPELVKSSKNGIPVRTSVAEEFKDENPLFEAYDENSEYLFNFTGNVPGYNELRQVFYPELQAVYTGEKTAKEAVESYQEKGNKIIEDSKADSVIED